MKLAIRVLALSASLFALADSASALTIGGPTMGIWWNPSESGRGYEIDLQGDTMVVTTYVYEQSGDPIWYLSSGTYDHTTGVFQSAYDIFANGQCFGCTYAAPDHTGDAGPITITFHTNQTATLTYPGGSTEISKFQYGFATRTDALYGEWALTYITGGNVGGDWVVLDTPYTDPSSGTKFVSGHAVGNATTTVLGIYDPTFLEAQIEVTAGTTKRLYRFGVYDDRRVIGIMNSTTGTTTVGPYTATGARLLYKSELASHVIGQGALGPLETMPASEPADTAAAMAKFERAAESLEARKD
jgi:hypothetical protein